MKLICRSEMTKFSPSSPVRRVIFESPHLRVISFSFEPGQEMPVHEHHAHGEIAFLILEGEGIFTREDLDFIVKSGSLLVMPASKAHGFRATTRLQMLVFIAPPF